MEKKHTQFLRLPLNLYQQNNEKQVKNTFDFLILLERTANNNCTTEMQLLQAFCNKR